MQTENPKKKDEEVPPGTPDRTPVEEPNRDKKPMGDPKPGRKKKKL